MHPSGLAQRRPHRKLKSMVVENRGRGCVDSGTPVNEGYPIVFFVVGPPFYLVGKRQPKERSLFVAASMF